MALPCGPVFCLLQFVRIFFGAAFVGSEPIPKSNSRAMKLTLYDVKWVPTVSNHNSVTENGSLHCRSFAQFCAVLRS